MGMISIINARVVTMNARAHGATNDAQLGARHGAAMSDLGVIENGHVCVRDGVITSVAPGQPASLVGEVIDAGGRVCMPALIDCHTHLCFAGNRWSEWEQLRAGESYESILAAGGGIMSTVRATKEATVAALAQDLGDRLRALANLGVGSVEVKTGYGLDWQIEI